MTIVYWSEAEAQRMATKEEGIHADFSPTVFFHAAPHVSVSVAVHTYSSTVQRCSEGATCARLTRALKRAAQARAGLGSSAHPKPGTHTSAAL